MLLSVHLMPEPDQPVAQLINDRSLLVNCIVLPVDDVELRYVDAMMTGVGLPSKMIVTPNVLVPMFPAASDAVQVTIVVPTEKLEPEGGEHVGPEVTPTSSDAVIVKPEEPDMPVENVIVLPAELEVEFVMPYGTVITGAVMSLGLGCSGETP